MDKQAINDLLEEKHQQLFEFLENQPYEKWIQGPNGKWTTGQHAQHLLESIKKVNHAMSFPSFVLKYQFGTANRALRDYDAITQRYQEKLAANQENAKKFNRNLKTPSLKDKKRIVDTLKIQNKKLQYKTNKWKDKNLDNLILPHPLMGKMPVREIVMWTAHHVEHHTQSLKENY